LLLEGDYAIIQLVPYVLEFGWMTFLGPELGSICVDLGESLCDVEGGIISAEGLHDWGGGQCLF
jgi:hypothetical protein